MLIGAAIVVLIAIAATAGILANRSDGGGTASPKTSTTPSTAPSTPPSPSAAAMTAFVRSYLSTVTSNPDQAFGRLTSAFQASSGGLKGYEGFWGTVREATPSNITADPDRLTVSYDVAYKMRRGKDRSDSVTLYLQRDGDGFKISGDNNDPPG